MQFSKAQLEHFCEFACILIGSAHNQLKTSIQHAPDLNAPVVDIDINRAYCALTLLPPLTLARP